MKNITLSKKSMDKSELLSFIDGLNSRVRKLQQHFNDVPIVPKNYATMDHAPVAESMDQQAKDLHIANLQQASDWLVESYRHIEEQEVE